MMSRGSFVCEREMGWGTMAFALLRTKHHGSRFWKLYTKSDKPIFLKRKTCESLKEVKLYEKENGSIWIDINQSKGR